LWCFLKVKNCADEVRVRNYKCGAILFFIGRLEYKKKLPLV
jgi:hypothetical protein